MSWCIHVRADVTTDRQLRPRSAHPPCRGDERRRNRGGLSPG
jgi:hypothetical protein